MHPRPGIAAAALATTVLLASACSERVEYRGSSLRFDGDGDHAEVGRVGATDPLALAESTFTLSAWFLQDPGGDPYQRIVDKSDGMFGHNGWALGADGATGQIHLYSNHGDRGGDFVSRRGAYTTGRWHHVVAVARADRHEIWIDGRRDRDTSFEDGVHALPAAAATELRIGTWNHDQGREWKGLLGELAVWRRDLRAEEIVQLAGSDGRRDLHHDWGSYAGSADLVGYWRPGADGASVILDLSPTRANARIVRIAPRGR